MPDALVIPEPAKVAAAPEPGAVKTTVAPATAVPLGFVTRTARPVAKAVLMRVLWLLPADTAIVGAVNVAAMVWFATTFVNVYDVGVPTETPSILTSAIEAPVLGVMV